MACFKPIEERVEGFRRFYRRENPRPLFGFFMGSEYPLLRYEAAKALPTERDLSPDDFPVEGYLEDCDRLFEVHEACGGNFIWSASAFWGIPWLEAALGCPLRASHATGSISTRPPEGFSGAGSLPEFDAESPWMEKTREFLLAIAERSAGRYPIGTTRMRGIADLLSALHGGERFIYAMMEEPEALKELCARLTDFWIAYGKLQLENIPPFHGGVGSFYYNMWAPAGTVWHQEDAAALLSPPLYDKFIRSSDERIAEAFEGCILHLHSTGYIPLDAYLGMDLTALELHIDEGGPRAEQLFETHGRILRENPLLIWGNIPKQDLDWIFSKLPPAGLAVMTVVSTPEEAHRLWDEYGS